MQTERITWGEPYPLTVAALDPDGNAITLDGTWQAAARVTKIAGGPSLIDPVVTIANGVVTCTLDTGAPIWKPGTYLYDVRITDPDGNDYWSEMIQLSLTIRNTPPSA